MGPQGYSPRWAPRRHPTHSQIRPGVSTNCITGRTGFGAAGGGGVGVGVALLKRLPVRNNPPRIPFFSLRSMRSMHEVLSATRCEVQRGASHPDPAFRSLFCAQCCHEPTRDCKSSMEKVLEVLEGSGLMLTVVVCMCVGSLVWNGNAEDLRVPSRLHECHAAKS